MCYLCTAFKAREVDQPLLAQLSLPGVITLSTWQGGSKTKFENKEALSTSIDSATWDLWILTFLSEKQECSED